jgi:hypothetical protein
MLGDISIDRLECCGVAEISGISTYKGKNGGPKQTVIDLFCHTEERWNNDTQDYDDILVLDESDDLRAATFIFTQASSNKKPQGYGYALRDYIVNEGLGAVVVSEPGINPNTGRYIHTFAWTLDERGFAKWAERNKIEW